MGRNNDPWKEVRDGFDRWLKITCYLAFVWVLLDLLPHLPAEISKRIVEAILGKLGI